MNKSTTYFDLMDACKLPGCPLCRMEKKSVEKYLDSMFYEKVNDIPLRARLRASMGFCSSHAEIALNGDGIRGNALGLAIIYNDILLTVMQGWDAKPGKWTQPLGVTQRCVVCEQQEESSRYYMNDLVNGVRGEEDMRAALQRSNGLCMAHLLRALDQLKDAKWQEWLVRLQRPHMEAIHKQLLEFIRKNDYRFAGEEFGEERDSWKRATEMGSGKGLLPRK